MFTTGFLNKQNKSNMSFNQDINFHRAAKHLRSSTHSSPQRMLSCPNPGGTMHRFKPAQTGSNVSLNSACSSKDEGSSGECSDHNHSHHHHHDHHREEAPDHSGAFDRNQSLQSSFNSDHSSSRESDVGFLRGDDSPTISDVQPFTKLASTNFETSSPTESHNNNLIEMTELKKCQYTGKKKKKTKKSSKSSNSSASSVVSDGSNGSGDIHATVVPSGGALDVAKDSSSSWYQFMMPSYKSRLSTFHSTFLNIPTTEAVVDDFLCALHRDILLQGRLYVSVNYIAFYSNILGYETKVVINFKDVKHISKATTIKLFHNAIEVYTFDGTKYFFTSFVSREKCFKVLKLLWESASGLGESQKIDWNEICRIIRQNYSTQTLGANLTDLEDADLEKHLSKGKSVRKRLQKKKDRLKSMNNSSDSALSIKSQADLPDGDEDEDEFEDTLEEEASASEDVADGGSSCRPVNHHEILVTESPFISQCRECVQTVMGAISPAYHLVRQCLAKESTRVYLCYAMIILIFCLHIHLMIRIGTVNERLEIFTNLAKQAMSERMHRQSLGVLAATNSQVVVASSSNSLQHNQQQQLTTTFSSSSATECSQCHFNLSPT